MARNKPRLYVALYARGGAARMPGGEDGYHWALITGPKREADASRGKRYHAKEPRPGVWEYSEQNTGTASTLMILVRIRIAKVKNMVRLEQVLRSVPIRVGQPGWNCVEWVREALSALAGDGKALGTSRIDWQTVRVTAMRYVRQKAAEHRFDGRARPGQFNPRVVPTFDLLAGREVIQ
ncbi:Putative protein of unknown function [Podospora comata]|uniref:Transposase n=1 Tax=Podospora comata TaxID=48703 RepID=A0ABY6S8H7_PODCO|nr:Putative protein of unknown function [Podospora comata]